MIKENLVAVTGSDRIHIAKWSGISVTTTPHPQIVREILAEEEEHANDMQDLLALRTVVTLQFPLVSLLRTIWPRPAR